MKLGKCPSCESYGSFVSVQVDGDSKSQRSLKEWHTLTQHKEIPNGFEIIDKDVISHITNLKDLL